LDLLKVTETATIGTRLLDRVVLPHSSLLVASVPRDQPVSRRPIVGLVGIIAWTNIRWDGFGASWNALIAASDEIVVATKPDGELREQQSIVASYHS